MKTFIRNTKVSTIYIDKPKGVYVEEEKKSFRNLNL